MSLIEAPADTAVEARAAAVSDDGVEDRAARHRTITWLATARAEDPDGPVGTQPSAALRPG
jgi:hypothetical protein